MFHIVLVEPEIPPNTGNVIRLSANTGAQLHLVQPLGFSLDDKKLKRAGLDYHDWAKLQIHNDLNDFVKKIKPARLLACSTHGKTSYAEVKYQNNDALIFGPETRGLPKEFLASLPVGNVLRIPMQPNNRSLNLSNAVAIILYEAWRQLGFQGGA